MIKVVRKITYEVEDDFNQHALERQIRMSLPLGTTQPGVVKLTVEHVEGPQWNRWVEVETKE